MAKKEVKKQSSEQDNTQDNINKTTDLIELEQELKYINPQVFQGVDPRKKQEILRSFSSITLIQERSHTGPLPDPDTLIQYNTVIPEGADRIMKMAERQQEHRMSIEKKVIASQSFQSLLGQIFGLIIGLFGIACGVYLSINGQPTVGGIIAGGTVVSLVSVFVIGKKNQKNKD